VLSIRVHVHVDRMRSLQRHDSVNGLGVGALRVEVKTFDPVHKTELPRRRTGVAAVACSVGCSTAVVSWPCPGPRRC
jgi:hypothetical protein